jgi:NAD(P)-dependent dehydrogenase (short-subunit alcohol dehydrogenase family)
MANFEGLVALVSGAAGGIGAAVCGRLDADGATVVGCDITSKDGVVTCDVRDDSSCDAVVAGVLSEHGRLDILANIAGVTRLSLIDDVTPDQWRMIIDVNLTGTFLLSRSALPALRVTKGVIVNMASVAGLRATPYNAAYCASKGGVVMLTKSMAIELAGSGVRVNAVCPSSVDTPMLRGLKIPDGADVSLLTRAASPMGRVVDPTEIAAAVSYLASKDAATISGTTLVIDGAASA